MRRWRWEVPILVLLAAAVLAGGGYLAFNSLTELRPDYGGRLVEGVAGGPSTLNPLLAQFNDADKDISSLVFSGLTRLSPNGELVPDLAQRWDIEDGGRRYRFVLRDGVRWHDGIPFTADDVVFSFKMIQAKDFPGSTDLAALWKDVGIAKKDDLTVEFTLPQPYAPFLSTTTLGIVPVHLLRDVRPADLTRAPFNANPIGAGPYRLIEAYVDRMILKANPD
ncbi:MAG: ABC transporter substrate-binding protein, partial [Chloroflexi bacterium]|nr:ABC transporter substrate-binding protein [Chloroflexota bacterium]